MPLYDYKHTRLTASECSEYFETFQRVTARPLKRCPNCGVTVQRVMRAPAAVVTKGLLINKDADKNLPRNADGSLYRYTEKGEKNRKREAERHIKNSLLKNRPDNPFGLEVHLD